MTKKRITIEDLASMVKHGFDDVTSKMARKVEVDREFGEVRDQLERIEKLIFADCWRSLWVVIHLRGGPRLAAW